MAKIYLAGSFSETIHTPLLEKYGIKNILNSYYYEQNRELAKGFNIFLDSGAYSAWALKKKIDLQKYIQYIGNNKENIEIYASLDVIGNAEETYKNYIIMKQTGLKPLPTFHVGEDFKWLKLYCEETDYIALGGMVPYKADKKILPRWLKKCFEIIPKNVKVHGFGYANEKGLRMFPFYSVDVSSWARGSRWGEICYFTTNK